MQINVFFRKNVLFPLSRQFEFLTNYTSLKTDASGHEILHTKEVLLALKDIYAKESGVDSIEYRVCNSMLSKLGEGLSFFETMDDWFHPDICLTYKISLAAGSQRAGVEAIITTMKLQNQRKNRFFKAMILPLIIFIAGVAVFCGMSIGILPTFFYSPEELKKATGLVSFTLKMGDVINKYWPVFTIGLLPIIICFFYFMPKKGLTEIYRNFSAGRFFSLLSLLINSSLTVKDSLLTLQPHVSPYLQDHIENMLDMTQEGSTEFRQLDTGLLPLRLRVRLHVSGKAGAASALDIFSVIASHAGEDFDDAIQKTQGLIKWSVMGVGLGLLCLSFASIFSMAATMMIN